MRQHAKEKADQFLAKQREKCVQEMVVEVRCEYARKFLEERQAKRLQEIIYAENRESLKMIRVIKAYREKKGKNPSLGEELYGTVTGVFPWHSSEVEKSEELFEQIGREWGIRTRRKGKG